MTKSKPKKKKKSHPVLDYALYVFVRIFAIFIQMMDVNTSLRLACQLGKGLYAIYGRGRQRAIDHLRASFPEKDQAWLERTACRSFEHIVMLAFDVIHNSRHFTPSTWHRYIEMDDMSPALKLLMRGRGIIMVTGHYGNFEVSGVAMGTFGLETYSIARPLDNRFLNDYLLKARQRQGQIIIDKKGATDQMLEILQSGASLGFIADQDAGRKGMFVDFFGRKASTYKSIGLLAMEFNLPVVIGYCRRINNQYRFKLGITKILSPSDGQDKDHPLLWITQEYTRAIEEMVREEPEQYWWVHRRWKHQPPERRKSVKAADVSRDSTL